VCYTYVLRSDHDQRFYTGTTRDLRTRIELHSDGKVRSTAHRRPLALVYWNRLGSYLTSFSTNKLERH
jgi:putative endonuclease